MPNGDISFDKLVYNLYRLTEEAVKVVEGVRGCIGRKMRVDAN